MRRLQVSVLVLSTVLSTACGTRVKEAAAPISRPAVQSAPEAVRGASVPASEQAASPTASPVAEAVTGTTAPHAVATPAKGGPASVRPGAAGGAASRSQSPGASAGATSAPTVPARPGPQPSIGGGGGAAPSAPSKVSPLVVASVGHYSGPAASTLKPVLEGAQLWVNAVNGRGGVNSHPVRLLVYDDAGDPARHRAQVQEAVERKGVMAFLAQQAPLTEAATVEYITNKRIPVIGSEGGTPGFYESPMYFPQHSSREALFSTWVDTVAARARTLGKNKVGLLYCVEANDCATYDKVFRNEAKQAGLELVYEAKATITQPDYTAECLSARNAGAQLVTMILDSNSVGRVASSCHRQGYDPQYVIGAAVALDRFKDDPLLADLTAATSVFPYFETGTPATDEFQAAVRSLGRGLTYGVGLATGWTAGKLLEKATKALPEPPTSAAVLAGLWSIHNDTLGGLTGPLSFTENQPAKPFVCGWHIQISKGAWVTPDGFAIHCR